MNTYNVYEAASYCKCHPETIRKLIRTGALIASKPGRRWCITQAALDDFLARLENQAVQALLEKRSEQQCLSLKETTYGISTLQQQAAEELNNLLGLQTSKKHKNCTIN